MNDKKIALHFAKKNGFSIVVSKKDDAGQVYFEAYALDGPECSLVITPPKNCSDRGEGRMDGEIERSNQPTGRWNTFHHAFLLLVKWPFYCGDSVPSMVNLKERRYSKRRCGSPYGTRS